MRRRRTPWLVAAALLVALAAAITWTEGPKKAKRRDVEFPSYLRPREERRLSQRRRELSLRAASGGAEERRASRDPLLVAVSGAAARGSSMVFEIGALKGTPIGRMVADCLARRPDDPFAKMTRETGFDPARDVDRVAVAGDLVVVGGDFGGADGGRMFPDLLPSSRGRATVYSSKADGREEAAVWDGELLLVSRDGEALEEALGLLSGDVPFDEDAVPESESYGEIYGSLSVDDAKKIFGGDADLARRFSEAADEVAIHVDASDDVAIVTDVNGGEAGAVKDLARAVGGAMSVARMKAIADGEDDLAELLDYANVDDDGDGMEIELALPLGFLERRLKDCAWMGD